MTDTNSTVDRVHHRISELKQSLDCNDSDERTTEDMLHELEELEAALAALTPTSLYDGYVQLMELLNEEV